MSTDTSEVVSSEMDSVRAHIFGDRQAEIKRTEHRIPWNEPVHAVNWFNTRSLFLYNFYNLIAYGSVRQVGGVPFFKGRISKQLVGNEKDSRSVLLVVKYPSAINFRSMLENTYFKVASILRTLAVKEFTFCLTKSEIAIELTPVESDSQSYLVHHFRGNNISIELVRELIYGTSIELVFSSLKSHEVMVIKANKVVAPVPNIMDGILLFRAIHSTALESFVTSKNYRSIIDSTDSSFIGLLERLM